MSADFTVARALAYADAWVQGDNLVGMGSDRAAFATLAAEVRRLKTQLRAHRKLLSEYALEDAITRDLDRLEREVDREARESNR